MNIPKVPDGMLRAVWNYDLNVWEETATQEEILEFNFNQSVKFYNSELEFANKASTEFEFGIIDETSYNSVKDYIIAIDPYKVVSKIARHSRPQRPPVFDRYN